MGGGILVKLARKKKQTHGGYREGQGGRRTFFRGKSGKSTKPMYDDVPPPQTILLTRDGFDLMEEHCERLTKDHIKATGKVGKAMRISRSIFVEGLIRVYGSKLTIAQIRKADDTQ
jgi:hypothetical protein